MHVQINAPHEPLTDAFVEHVESTLNAALAHHAPRLTRIEVHFRDLNAGKGGIDKRCVIEARPSGLSPLAVDHESEGLREAFRGALDKLERLLAHRLGKQSSRNPQPPAG